jgi:hypothetical protein
MAQPLAHAQLDLDTWIARLETEPEWSERLRATARALAIRPSDLVLLVGTPEDFPRASKSAPLVRGHLVTVGRVADVPLTFPSAGRPSMNEAERAAHPGHAHAVIFAGPFVDSVRFRVPALVAPERDQHRD